MRILFTGARAPVTLELVRNFKMCEWEVYAADSIKPALAQFSKHLKKFFILSAPRFNENDFITDLIKIINENSIDILFPTCEEIFWISKNIDKIRNNCTVKIICDDIKKLSLLHNKYRFIQFAQAQNLPVPETHILRAEENFNQKSVIKPVFSRFGSEVFIADNHTQVRYSKYNNKPYILQEYINGESVCSYGFAQDGTIKFNICYKSPFKAKTCTAFQPFSNAQINSAVRAIVEKLNFSGNISFDFIQKGQKFYLIECNPRITSGIHTLYNNSFEELFFGTPNNLIAEKVQLLAPTVMNHFKLLPYPDVIWNKKDLKPFLNQIRCLAVFASNAIKHRISLTKAMTYDIEWNDEHSI